MSCRFRTPLVAFIGIVLLAPATGAASGWQQPPGPPQDELAPPPPPPTTPAEPEEPVEPAGPTSITITVPPLPAKKPAAQKAKPKQVTAERSEPVRRTTPRRRVRAAEPVSDTRDFEAPAVEATPAAGGTPKAKAKPKPKPKPAKKKLQRQQPRVVAKATAPARPIRDGEHAGAVLAAQFTLRDESEGGGVNQTVLILALVFAAVLGSVVGVVGAAPLLADRWPKVFVPVMDATERVVLAGICLAGAALTLVITWALTGPGG